ncbi:NADH-quinone oxidoreductase subunit NuoG [bacterium endosymbiont of Pedicinus badii]|uniref:NADH-quinone oxidoreductase subunit NuoG n=1 Tax=bacterium endosymbiont of Pedicinus badii TaxID=1719126 RepID=UPI0009BB9416|nr:NADH-quinone oxidoreductase subunit NuoG [bacterium endosymbiont of Pedicinus badii]OQM34452.1 hypothetical protein AOQ89_01005 [bacterium endosymbiont of Pedicinus badii]
MTFNIQVDGKKYKVNSSINLLQFCLSLKIDIPYFCWHPALGSIGSCRQCAVKKIENNTNRIVMSCMTPIEENSVFITKDKEIQKFRKNIIECMMTNHPHDCPICEEGGNCHLQDMTVMVRHNKRRYEFAKKIQKSQYLGPFIKHEMNRCISCYRCVRYYRNYSGGKDFGVYGSKNRLYFGRIQSGNLKSEFSGNLIDICPTGVFTDKIHSENYNRKWDMNYSPSICHNCSLGCNISVAEKYGKIIKIENRYHENINSYFLCDKGRFGFSYANLDSRPKKIFIKKNNKNIKIKNYKEIKILLKNFLDKKIFGIGSPKSSLESNFALQELVGKENFYIGISKKENIKIRKIIESLKKTGIKTPSLKEVESYDAILILSEDVTQTAPRMALSIRQSINSKKTKFAKKNGIQKWHFYAINNIAQNIKYPLIITSIYKTKLDDISYLKYSGSIEKQIEIGFLISNQIDEKSPKVNSTSKKTVSFSQKAAKILIKSQKPLIITGTQSNSTNIIISAINIAISLKRKNKKVGISFILPNVNSFGSSIIEKKSIEEIKNVPENSTLIVLESNILEKMHHKIKKRIVKFFKTIIFIDSQKRKIVEKKINIFLPCASFAEGSGLVVNQEGRIQNFFKAYDTKFYNKNSDILDSWKWIYLMYAIRFKKKEMKFISLEQIRIRIVKKYKILSKIQNFIPNSKYAFNRKKTSRCSIRYSGKNAIFANINVHERNIKNDRDTIFSFSTEEIQNTQSKKKEIPFFWYPGWNSNNALNKYQKNIGGKLLFGNPGEKMILNKLENLVYFKIPHLRNFQMNTKFWKFIPYWHIFFSEENLQKCKNFKIRYSNPYIFINKKDAVFLKKNSNSIVKFFFENIRFKAILKVSTSIDEKSIAIPFNFSKIPEWIFEKKIKNIRKILQ